MKKLVLILLFCFIAVGLIFGCTETTTPSNTNNGAGSNVTPDNTNNNTNNGANTGASEIPQPPALPE